MIIILLLSQNQFVGNVFWRSKVSGNLGDFANCFKIHKGLNKILVPCLVLCIYNALNVSVFCGEESLWTSFITLLKFSYLCLNIPCGVRIRKYTKKITFWLSMTYGCLLNFQVQIYIIILKCASVILLYIYTLCKVQVSIYRNACTLH